MPNSTGKGTTDADISSLRALFHEMEEEEVVDCTLCGHECARAPACGDGAAATDSACLNLWLSPFRLVQRSCPCTSSCPNYFVCHMVCTQVRTTLRSSRSQPQFTSTGPRRHRQAVASTLHWRMCFPRRHHYHVSFDS